MGPRKRIFITLGAGALLILSFYLITGAITKFTGYCVSEDVRYGDFELCLQEQDITLYVNAEVPAESLRRIQLIDYLEDVKIFNCLRDNEYCQTKGVSIFPTWIINGNVVTRDISIYELSDYSSCVLINVNR